MRFALIVLALVGALAACAAPPGSQRARAQARAQDRESLPAPDFTFSSRSKTDVHDANDPVAEAGRLNEIAQRLRTNGMCPKGYTITARRVIVQLGEKDQIDYRARCTT